MEIKVLVADDELPARGELKYQLASMPHVNVIGECANGKEVISFLETHPQVDLLFLDIEMPIMNGLEAAQKIIGMNHSVKIVFATGYSQFALQAFELEAFDYILKPYDEERIAKTIQRLFDSIMQRENGTASGEIINARSRISLQTKNKTLILSPSKEIVLISTEKSDNSLFYTTEGIIRSKMTLRDAEALLAEQGVAAVARTVAPDLARFGVVHDVLDRRVAGPAAGVLLAFGQRRAHGVHAGHELAIGAQHSEHRFAHARHEFLVHRHIGAVGQLDADVGDVRAQRAHAERHHIHRAPAHAAAV